MLYRLSQRSFNFPPISQARTQCVVRHITFSCPLFYCLSTIIQCQQDVISSIIILIVSCSPIAILFLVCTVVVTTFQCMFRRWSRPHVGEKIFKRIHPAFTYSDTASAVIVNCRTLRTQDAILHAAPHRIFGGSGHPVLNTAREKFSIQTSTTPRFSPIGSGQIIFCDRAFSAAETATQPVCSLSIVGRGNPSQHRPAAKRLASEINKIRQESPPVVSWIGVRGDLARKPGVGSDPYAAQLS